MEVDQLDDTTKKQHEKNRDLSEKIVELNDNIKKGNATKSNLNEEVEARMQANELLKQRLEERAACVKEFK